MIFKNYTQHDIRILKQGIGYSEDMVTKNLLGNASAVITVIIIPTLCDASSAPRAYFGKEKTEFFGNIPMVSYEHPHGFLTNMPAAEPDTLIIVSDRTASVAKMHRRNDCVVPHNLVRDAENPDRILGCLSLRRIL